MAALILVMPAKAGHLVVGEGSERIADCAACLESHGSNNVCDKTSCTETCPSGWLHFMSGCCGSGVLAGTFEKSSTTVALFRFMYLAWDFHRGINPEALPEPP
jgi:hypothetical protein